MEKYRDYEEKEIIESEKKMETSDFDSEVPKNFKPEADTITAMQKETVDAPDDKDIKSEELKLKAENAVEDSIKDRAERGLVPDNITELKGIASEAAACETIGENARNLNEHTPNYKRIDISSESEAASVKTHGSLLEGELNEEAIKGYVKDFIRIKEHTAEDGANLIKARDAGYPVPDEIKKAKTGEEAKDSLNKITTLRISEDHVDPMRDIIAEMMVKSPQDLGESAKKEDKKLAEGLTKEEADRNVNERIKGVGLKQKDIIDISVNAVKNIKRKGRGR